MAYGHHAATGTGYRGNRAGVDVTRPGTGQAATVNRKQQKTRRAAGLSDERPGLFAADITGHMVA